MARKPKLPPSEQPTLLFSDVAPDKHQGEWFMVTNHRNLCYMLAAGLILPPAGFGQKYYTDSLSLAPGWIPLFKGPPPTWVVEQATSEGRGSIPCLISINIDSIAGKGFALDAEMKLSDMHLLDGKEVESLSLLIPAPLPLTIVKSVRFRNQDEKLECEIYAGESSNVPHGDFKLVADASAFEGKVNFLSPSAPPQLTELRNYNQSPDVPLTYGGIMALLAKFANREMRCTNAAIAAFEPELEFSDGGLLAPLSAWCASGKIPDSFDTPTSLFWQAVDALARQRTEQPERQPPDVLIGCLEGALERFEPAQAEKMSRLIRDLRDLGGFADMTISEVLQRHPKPFSRAMILFCLRDSTRELVNFDHEALTVDDYLAAGILFAAREGWIGIPAELRNQPGLWQAATHRMAVLAHTMLGSGITFGTPSHRPRFLREFFGSTDSNWSQIQTDAALDLARREKWDCIRTIVKLPKGSYRLEIEPKGVLLELRGDITTLRPEIEREAFSGFLSACTISPEIEAKILKFFKD